MGVQIVKLSTEQIAALDAIRAEAARMDQLRRSINARQAATRLPFDPVYLCALSHLVNQCERALWEHERASVVTPAQVAERKRRALEQGRAAA